MAGLLFLISVINNGLAGRRGNLKYINHRVDVLMGIKWDAIKQNESKEESITAGRDGDGGGGVTTVTELGPAAPLLLVTLQQL